jgi:hypothetical protein
LKGCRQGRNQRREDSEEDGCSCQFDGFDHGKT